MVSLYASRNKSALWIHKILMLKPSISRVKVHHHQHKTSPHQRHSTTIPNHYWFISFNNYKVTFYATTNCCPVCLLAMVYSDILCHPPKSRVFTWDGIVIFKDTHPPCASVFTCNAVDGAVSWVELQHTEWEVLYAGQPILLEVVVCIVCHPACVLNHYCRWPSVATRY